MIQLSKETLTFLKRLENNNTREWFEAHKPEFKNLEGGVKKFVNSVYKELEEHDRIEKIKLFRIYRDVRFSKDKTPYKSHFAIAFHREKPALRGGYYLRIKPGDSFVAAGFWNPNKKDLLRIRKELEVDASEYREHTENTDFQKIWGSNIGEAVKTAPKGFSKEHSNIKWIRYKQHIYSHSFTDKEVMDPDFGHEIVRCFRAIRPFFDYMSNVLTTNLNGESIL